MSTSQSRMLKITVQTAMKSVADIALSGEKQVIDMTRKQRRRNK